MLHILIPEERVSGSRGALDLAATEPTATDTPDQAFEAYLKKKDKERAERKAWEAQEREAREKERERRKGSPHDRDSRWGTLVSLLYYS